MSMKTIQLLFILALLFSTSFAAITYTGNQTLEIKWGNRILTEQLLNKLENRSGELTIVDGSIDGTPGCGVGVFDAKLCVKFVLDSDKTLGQTNKIEHKVAKSTKGTVKQNGFTIYSTILKNYTQPIYTTNTTTLENGSIISDTVFSHYQTTYYNETLWRPFDWDGFEMEANKEYIIGYDYRRDDLTDVADLIPSIFGEDATAWAWWNTSYPSRMLVNCTNAVVGSPILINGSNGFNFNGTAQKAYVACYPNTYVYGVSDNAWAVGNETSQVPTCVLSGNVSSYNCSQVFNSRYVGVWFMNEPSGTNTINALPYNNGTIVTGVTLNVTGPVAKSYTFSGSSSRVNISYYPQLNTTNMSIAFWVKMTGQANKGLVYKGDLASSQGDYEYIYDTTPNPDQSKYRNDGAGANDAISTNTTLADNGWHRVYVTYSNGGSGNKSIYFDGSYQASSAGLGTAITSNNLWFGCYYSTSFCFAGSMSDVRVLNYTMTLTDVASEWSNYLNTAGYGNLGPNETAPVPVLTPPTVCNITSPSIAYRNSTLNSTASGATGGAGALSYYFIYTGQNNTILQNSTNSSFVCNTTTQCNKTYGVSLYCQVTDGINWTTVNISNETQTISYQYASAGIATGNSTDFSAAYDSDYSTSVGFQAGANIFLNFTNANFTNTTPAIKLQVKMQHPNGGGGPLPAYYTNYTLDSTCQYKSPLQIKIVESDVKTYTFYCYNSTDWVNIGEDSWIDPFYFTFFESQAVVYTPPTQLNNTPSSYKPIQNSPPTQPGTIIPNSATLELNCTYDMMWPPSTDPDPEDTVSYNIFACLASNLSNCTYNTNSTTNSSTFDISIYQNGTGYRFNVTATDGVANSVSRRQTATSTIKHFNFIDENHTTPQYSQYTYQANITANWSVCLSPTMTYNVNGTNYPSTNVGQLFYSTANAPIAAESGSINKDFTWYINYGNFTGAISTYTVPVRRVGLMECDITATLPSLNYTIVDFATGAAVTAGYTISWSSGTYNRTITGTGSTAQLCILPPNETFVSSFVETYNATGYDFLYTTRSGNYSNVSQAATIYMTAAGTTKPTTIYVYQPPTIGLSGATVNVYRYIAPTYTLISSCTTNNIGSCVMNLIPLTVQYKFEATYGGETVTDGPSVLSCDPAASTCSKILYIDQYPFPYIINGTYSGSCVYTNSTRTLQCTGADTGGYITQFRLRVLRGGNNTAICDSLQNGSSATMSCVLPNVSGTYNYAFNGYRGTIAIPFSTGQITDLQDNSTTFGRSGWLAALMVFMVCAGAAFFSLPLSILLGIGGVGISVILGFLPASMGSILMLIVFAGGVVIYKLRSR